MLQALRTIHILTQTLQSLLPMQAEHKRALNKKIRLEFNYNSNHIEGNTLTYGETELLLIFGKTEGQHELREYEEMQAHDVAFKMIQEWAADSEMPLTEMAVKNLNEIVLVKPYWKEAETPDGQAARRLIKVGDYKEYPNHVRLQNGEIFEYALPAETPIQMGELMDWYRREEEKAELDPAVLAAMLHYKFVRIHPFDDGNGRISRLLMNYVLLKNNLPPVIIKSADKKGYLFALNQADTGNIEAFITYIAEQCIWSLELYIKAAKGESLDEPGDLDKKLVLLKKQLGEDVDARVELKYGEEAVKYVIENSMVPLLSEWDNILEKFEILFNERLNTMYFNKVKGYENIDLKKLTADDILQIFLDLEFRTNIESVLFQIMFKGIRSKKNEIHVAAGEIDFSFYQNAYEISYSGSDKKINKLYHQSLTEEEITTITESLGNYLYNNIEHALAE